MDKNIKKEEAVWYDNPSTVTTFIIILIVLTIILSQSFAINNNLSVGNILSSILSLNFVYLITGIYFISLKTNFGKKYFDFLNIFLIILYLIITVTSGLTLFQSFGFVSLLNFIVNFTLLIHMSHTLLKNSRLWDSLGLESSPFNEISNSGYFNGVVIFSVILLAVELISTTSLDSTIVSLLDCFYAILFSRYIFLYGFFLDGKKKTNDVMVACKEKIRDSLDEFVDMNKIENTIDAIEDRVLDIKETVKDSLLKDNFVKSSKRKTKIDDSKKGNK